MFNIILFYFISLIIFIICFLPGYFLLKSIKKFEEEVNIAGSFGISFFLYSTIAFILFLLGTEKRACSILSIILVFILLILYLVKERLKSEVFKISPLFWKFLIYFFYILSFQAIIPIYAGAGWFGDWYEHYFRARIYLLNLPKDTRILDLYTIPSRTPLFNLVNTFFLSIFGDSFSLYQMVSTLLNTIYFLPAYLLAKKIFGGGIIPLFLLFVFLNPYLTRMATFTFSKSLTAYFVLMSIYFYICFREQINKTDKLNFYSSYLTLSSLFASLAYLTHQSAMFYILVIILDIIFFLIRGKIRPSLIYIPSLILVLSLLPWHLFVIKNYGLKEVVISSPTFSYEHSGIFKIWLQQRFYNLEGAFLPVIFLKYITAEGTNIFNNIWAFLGFQDRLLNFYFGAIPGVLTLSGIIFIFSLRCRMWIIPWSKREAKFLTKNEYKFTVVTTLKENYLFYLFLILFGFLGDILLVNNAGVPIGVAQNSMMPLLVLLIIFLLGELNKYLSNRKLYFLFGGLILTEFILTFGAHIFLLLFLPLKITSLFFENNFQLKFDNSLVFNYDFFPDKYWIFLFFIFIFLFYVFYNLLKKEDNV